MSVYTTFCICGHPEAGHGQRRSHDGHVYFEACLAGSEAATPGSGDDPAGGCACRKFIERGDAMANVLAAVDAGAEPTVTDRAQAILVAASNLIAGDRHDDYGPADDEFDRIAAGWQIIFEDGVVTSQRVSLAMIWMKSCRELAGHKADNWIDLAGYAALGGAL